MVAGTEEFEIDRLQDYMEDIEASCTTPLELSIPASDMVTLCLEGLQETSTKPCQLVLLRYGCRGLTFQWASLDVYSCCLYYCLMDYLYIFFPNKVKIMVIKTDV